MVKKNENVYTPEERKTRWLKYAVRPCFYPIIASAIYDWIIRNFQFSAVIANHFLDFILIICAMAASILYAATDVERNLSEKEREQFIHRSSNLEKCCFGAYGALYIGLNQVLPFFRSVLYITFFIFAVQCIRCGMEIELATQPPSIQVPDQPSEPS